MYLRRAEAGPGCVFKPERTAAAIEALAVRLPTAGAELAAAGGELPAAGGELPGIGVGASSDLMAGVCVAQSTGTSANRVQTNARKLWRGRRQAADLIGARITPSAYQRGRIAGVTSGVTVRQARAVAGGWSLRSTREKLSRWQYQSGS